MKRPASTGLIVAGLALLAAVAGLWLGARTQAGPGVSVERIEFTGASGARMRALLYRPVTATAARPAPAILAMHGYLNSAEMQGNFATEFARRGYVVLAADQRGHGGSAPPAFAAGYGGPDALAYLRTLPFVDRANIGLEGHSMGGWTVLSAAKAFPDGYKSLILEGSSVGAPFAPEGTAGFPRNLLVVYGLRDEFGGLMWGPESPLATGETQKLRTVFGTDQPVQPGRLYGNIDDGSARMLLTPFATHPWLHQSSTGIAPAIDWFGRTLSGARRIPADDQVWPWREAGDVLALLAVPVMMAGLLAAAGSALAIAPAAPAAAASVDTSRRRVKLAVVAMLPALLFIPLCMGVEGLIGQNALFRQTFTNQFAGWAFVCATLSFAVLLGAGWKPHSAVLPRAIAIAAAAVIPAYIVVWAGDRLLHVNPSWWFLTIRPLETGRVRDFALYAPFFIVNGVTSLRLIQSIAPLEKGSLPAAVARAVAAMSGGFVIFLIAQYGVLAMTGHLLIPWEGLRVISAIGLAAFLAFGGMFGAVSQRWTGSTLPGGIVAGLFFAWTLTATQPIGV